MLFVCLNSITLFYIVFVVYCDTIVIYYILIIIYLSAIVLYYSIVYSLCISIPSIVFYL